MSEREQIAAGLTGNKATERLKLWFFRDCNEGTRRCLFAAFGLPVDEIRCQSHERRALDYVLRAILESRDAD